MTESSFPKMTTACYLFPLAESSTVDEKLQVVGKTIIYNDPKNLSELKREYNFDVMFNTQHDFSRVSYNSLLAPLVKRAINGEDTLLIVGGSNAHSFQHYLLSQSSMHGLISQTSTQLLQSIHSAEEKSGSVTFSWYKLDNQSSSSSNDGIVDVLQDATGRGSSNSLPHPSSPGSNSATSPAPLTLRDHGRGRMVSPSGLLELEIANGSDIETVLTHVQSKKTLPSSLQSQQQQQPHHVMTLSVHRPTQITNNINNQQPSSQGSVTFLILGSLGSWTQNLREVLQAIEGRKAGPPFHKSRLTLLLREALMKRLCASSLLLLQCAEETQTQNLGWLGIWGSLGDKSASHSLSVTRAIRSASAGRLAKNNNSTDSADSKSVSGPVSGSAGLVRSNSSRYLSMQRIASTQSMSAANNAHNNGNNASLMMTPQPQPQAPQPLTRGLTQSNLMMKSAMGLTAMSNDNASNYGNNASSVYGGTNVGGPSNPSNPSPSVYADTPFDQLESTAALSLALEACRNENAALRVAYSYANERHKEVAGVLEELKGQLVEEGGALRDRDRLRYKRAINDLKDYTIYKEVMETALLRLQSELSLVTSENTALKNKQANEERNTQKQRLASDKYSKDLVTTKKRLTETENKVLHLEKQVKTLAKEKDMALSQLASYTQNSTFKLAHVTETLTLKLKEMEELSRKNRILDEKSRLLESEKESLLLQSSQEVAALRAAHAKALETLMGYQEENDALRGAVLELTTNNQTNPTEVISAFNSGQNSRRPSAAVLMNQLIAASGALSPKIPPPPPSSYSPAQFHPSGLQQPPAAGASQQQQGAGQGSAGGLAAIFEGVRSGNSSPQQQNRRTAVLVNQSSYNNTGNKGKDSNSKQKVQRGVTPNKGRRESTQPRPQSAQAKKQLLQQRTNSSSDAGSIGSRSRVPSEHTHWSGSDML